MKRFGRESAASRLVPQFEAPRPQPPSDMPEFAKKVWLDVTSCFRSDWFLGCESILGAYCTTASLERQIAAMLNECRVTDERYPELVRLYTSTVGSLISVGTKLRLTPQSSRDSRHVKHVAPGPRPWEVDLEPDAG